MTVCCNICSGPSSRPTESRHRSQSLFSGDKRSKRWLTEADLLSKRVNEPGVMSSAPTNLQKDRRARRLPLGLSHPKVNLGCSDCHRRRRYWEVEVLFPGKALMARWTMPS